MIKNLAFAGLTSILLSVPQTEIIQAQSTIPQVISTCETGESGTTFCGTWTWNGQSFDAEWENGATAKIMVEKFDSNSVVFTREDESGASIGLTARYEATPNGNQIEEGIVTWHWHWNSGRMQTTTGTWTASW